MQGTQEDISPNVVWPERKYSDFSLQVLTTRMHGSILLHTHVPSLYSA